VSGQLFADIVLGACALAALAWGALWVARLVRTVRAGEERLGRLERLALTDELTGMPNRRHWDEQLPRELGRSLRYDESVCVAMLDLDRFKDYNDTYGHQAGDRLLKEVTAAWRSVLRPYDLFARYGGEEFSLTMMGCELDDAVVIIERLRNATPAGTSCSAGVAQWHRNEDPSTLVGRADQALYEAKRAGRNRTIGAPTPLAP
jgi:diguanylate cyclase (GGDEF)-like protein